MSSAQMSKPQLPEPPGTLSLRDKAVSWTGADDGTVVILDLRTSRYLSVNRAASLLWRGLSEGTTRARLVEQLQGRFGLDDTIAQTDVDAFLADLRGRNLLVEQDV